VSSVLIFEFVVGEENREFKLKWSWFPFFFDFSFSNFFSQDIRADMGKASQYIFSANLILVSCLAKT